MADGTIEGLRRRIQAMTEKHDVFAITYYEALPYVMAHLVRMNCARMDMIEASTYTHAFVHGQFERSFRQYLIVDDEEAHRILFVRVDDKGQIPSLSSDD